MTFRPGDVVALKSGGQLMTVSGASDNGVECVWLGEEGELFRETLPPAVLRSVEDEAVDDDADEGETEEDEAEEDADQGARKIA